MAVLRGAAAGGRTGRVAAGGPAVCRGAAIRATTRALSKSPANTADNQDDSIANRIVKGIGYFTGFYSRSQVTLRAARNVYLSTSAHTANPVFYEVRWRCNLAPRETAGHHPLDLCPSVRLASCGHESVALRASGL